MQKNFKGGGTDREVNLLLLAHALEKGMGLPHPRSHFGFEKAGNLLELLEKYQADGRDTNRYAYIESLSILKTYLEFTDNDCEEYYKRCIGLCNQCSNLNAAGIVKVKEFEDLYKEFDLDQAKKFITTRHSFRDYIRKPVESAIVQQVIEMAAHAPSACNRQPSKVYFSNNPEMVHKIDALIPGNKGFEDVIPNWFIVTTDRNMFGTSEPFQWYVNGGIYLAYLTEALYAFGLGSCIFQIPPIHINVSELRKLASIPNNEAIIAAVGFGYPKSPNKYLAATRRPMSEVLKQF